MVSIFPILILSVIASLLGVRAVHLDRVELDLSPSSLACLRPDGARAVTRRWVAVLVTTEVAIVIGPAAAASAAPLPFSYHAFGFIYDTPALLSSPNAVANGVTCSSTGANCIPLARSVSGRGVAVATTPACARCQVGRRSWLNGVPIPTGTAD